MPQRKLRRRKYYEVVHKRYMTEQRNALQRSDMQQNDVWRSAMRRNDVEPLWIYKVLQT